MGLDVICCIDSHLAYQKIGYFGRYPISPACLYATHAQAICIIGKAMAQEIAQQVKAVTR